jgi:CheY-like chemotaxis protein
MIRQARHSGFDFRDTHALVVEDEEFARTLTSQVLRGFGCPSVQTAMNGNKAIDILCAATRSFDLIICDFRMPKMNGIELLKEIRKGVPGVARDIPFAMLTSHADKPVVGLAFELDVDCFLIKPITANTMRERLTRVMSTDRLIKPPYDYHEVDTDRVIDAGAEAADADRAAPAVVHNQGDAAAAAGGSPSAGGKGRVARDGTRILSLNAVKAGAILVDPVLTSGGQMLIPAGRALDKRTIERLRNLAEIDKSVREVHVEI